MIVYTSIFFMENNKDISKENNILFFLPVAGPLKGGVFSISMSINLFICMEDDDERLTNRLKMIIKQFSGDVRTDDGELIPEVAIKGHGGTLHCYAPSKKRFIKIARGTKAFVLSTEHTWDKTLIYTFCGQIVEIDEKELIETGFD